MKYTLLEMVQSILSSMDSDEVTSINDTTEALQVANVVRTAYFDIVNRSALPEQFALFQPTETSAITPTTFLVPDYIEDMKWIKYDYASVTDTQVNMQTLEFKPLKEFLAMQDRLNTDNDWVQPSALFTFDQTGAASVAEFKVTNNAPPRWYTVLNDLFIICDSYDSAVDTSLFLRTTKTQAYGRLLIAFDLEDNFTPIMDEAQFQLLLNEAKSLAWNELKQSPHQKAEQSAQRGWSQLQRSKHRVLGLTDFQQLPNYGRKGCNY